MKKIKISAVSYANTFPFLLGLEEYLQGDDYEITREVPSACAAKLIHQKADLGLIPIATIPLVPNAQIVSNYCIGAIGKVKTVLLMSKTKLGSITKVYLDSESRTSVQLVKVLAKHHWKKKWDYEILPKDYAHNPSIESMVLIGDKTQENLNFHYQYDLSEEWFNMTGKPFVFAAWVTNTALSLDFTTRFNNALEAGLKHITTAIDRYNKGITYDLEEYLKTYISYSLDKEKEEGLKLFLKYIEEL